MVSGTALAQVRLGGGERRGVLAQERREGDERASGARFAPPSCPCRWPAAASRDSASATSSPSMSARSRARWLSAWAPPTRATAFALSASQVASSDGAASTAERRRSSVVVDSNPGTGPPAPPTRARRLSPVPSDTRRRSPSSSKPVDDDMHLVARHRLGRRGGVAELLLGDRPRCRRFVAGQIPARGVALLNLPGLRAVAASAKLEVLAERAPHAPDERTAGPARHARPGSYRRPRRRAGTVAAPPPPARRGRCPSPPRPPAPTASRRTARARAAPARRASPVSSSVPSSANPVSGCPVVVTTRVA